MEKSNQFVTLPNEVVECDGISPKTLVIYCALKRHMDKDTRTCYPNIKTIAKEAGCGKDAVLSAIKELVDNEFIIKMNRPGKVTYTSFLLIKALNLYLMTFQIMMKSNSEKKHILQRNRKICL